MLGSTRTRPELSCDLEIVASPTPIILERKLHLSPESERKITLMNISFHWYRRCYIFLHMTLTFRLLWVR